MGAGLKNGVGSFFLLSSSADDTLGTQSRDLGVGVIRFYIL
jgi:hypothetical protein